MDCLIDDVPYFYWQTHPHLFTEDAMEAARIEKARQDREALLSGRNVQMATEGRELTQAERDRIEEERIARARSQREALLAGRNVQVATEGRELTQAERGSTSISDSA